LEPRKAPRSVHVASLSLLLVASVQAGVALLVSTTSGPGFAQWVFAAAVMGVLLWGIARGYRLAWLWGRYLGVVLAVTVVVAVGLGLWKGQVPWTIAAIMAGGVAVPLLVASAALGRPSSLRWFELYCPGCGAATNRGNDFLFREARCKACGDVF
jgi:hypothetical protein